MVKAIGMTSPSPIVEVTTAVATAMGAGVVEMSMGAGVLEMPTVAVVTAMVTGVKPKTTLEPMGLSVSVSNARSWTMVFSSVLKSKPRMKLRN